MPLSTPQPTGTGCTDGQMNGDETDIDCGGSCPGCGELGDCSVGADCSSGLCFEDRCRSPYPTAAPTPLPTQSPTATPCAWLDVPQAPRLKSAKFSSTGGQARQGCTVFLLTTSV
jgi:hypothetical protein